MENRIIKQNIEEEFKNSFLSYAMSVITDRALPDVRDGLKPVHRRIIYDMTQLLKLKSDGKYVKSARIVGDVIGKLHPHGDTSVYDAACRLSLDYIMRYPIIDGQGSFGSTDGDGAAAMRYTEMRPSKIMELITEDVKKNTVDMAPTFDEEDLEPKVLPGLFPNLLCNPTNGIAVSESCNFVPHNLTEICNGIIAYILNNNISLEEIMQYIKGPDFPLGGTIINKKDIYEAYKNGKTSNTLRIRGDYIIEDKKIIFTSIPFGANRSKIKEQINKSVNLLEGLVIDFNDESNRDGISIIFELESEEKAEDALKVIFKETDLEKTCPINNICLVNGVPKQLSLLQLIQEYVNHQNSVLIRAAEFDKEKAEKRVHILEGLLIALKDIDKVIELIRASKDKREARSTLMQYLSIDEIQANSILDMKLSRLTKLDEEDLKKELEEKMLIIEECKKTIEDNDYRNKKLISKIEKMRDKYGDARRTKLENITVEKEKKAKKEIPSTPVKISYTNGNLKIVKRANKNDIIIESSLDSNLAVFTNKGMCYKLPVIKINSSMQSIKSLIKMEAKEEVLFIIDFKAKGTLLFVTKQGMVKKTNIEDYNTNRSGKSIKLKDNDLVATISLLDSNKKQYLQLETKEYLLTFSISDISPTGKLGLGVRGIKLHENDEVISSKLIVNVDDKNLGKRNQVGKKKK